MSFSLRQSLPESMIYRRSPNPMEAHLLKLVLLHAEGGQVGFNRMIASSSSGIGNVKRQATTVAASFDVRQIRTSLLR